MRYALTVLHGPQARQMSMARRKLWCVSRHGPVFTTNSCMDFVPGFKLPRVSDSMSLARQFCKCKMLLPGMLMNHHANR